MASSVILVETPEISADTLEKVLLQGDLERLGTAERLNYYSAVCHSLGLNPLTRPFEYIRLNGKLTLYAKRECTEQLRKIHGVDIEIKSREVTEGCYVVTAGAKLPSGRRDESLGAVPIDTLKGEARANAMMKAETKAKRRVTMAICGLSFLDETEVDSVASAHRVPIDPIDGDIIPGSKEAAKAVAQEKIAEIVANKDRIAREAAAQAIYEPVNDISAATVMEERPVFSDEPGLQPPHDKELRDSIKKYGVRDTKKTPKKIEMLRSEERRVGKECRSRWSPYH